jgi:hypothetical protein
LLDTCIVFPKAHPISVVEANLYPNPPNLASAIDHFGQISRGLDRAELGVGPPEDDSTNVRPPPEALNYEKPSIRQTVKNNLLLSIVHPHQGFNRIKSAIHEKHGTTDYNHQGHAPTLAPVPPVSGLIAERLEHKVGAKPKFPPVKEFIRHPLPAIGATIRDQGGSGFAESLAKAEVSHGAEVQMLRQADKIDDASDEAGKKAEAEILVQMKQLRQDAFVRWTLDRHVRLVARMVEPDRPPPWPGLVTKLNAGNTTLTWADYSEAVSCFQPYSLLLLNLF